MNILLCYSNSMKPHLGGVQRVNDILANQFIRLNYSVYYLMLVDDKNDDYNYPVDVFYLPNADLYSHENVEFYHDLLRKRCIEVIINHDASNGRAFFFLNIGSLAVLRISLFHQNPLYGLENPPSTYPGKLFYHLLPPLVLLLKKAKRKKELQKLLKYSDKLVLLSKHYEVGLRSKLKLISNSIHSIPNPIENHQVEGKEFLKKKTVLYVGRLEFEQKRPDKLLLIWSKIKEVHPDWTLVFLGDGSYRMQLEEQARNLSLSNVKFVGFTNPIPYYEEASVLCLTSDYEGFGLVIAEAMQFGVVPIAFNNWISLKDLIIDYDTGIMVEQDNLDSFTQRLTHLLTDNQIRQQISKNARKYIRNYYIENIIEHWIHLIDGHPWKISGKE